MCARKNKHFFSHLRMGFFFEMRTEMKKATLSHNIIAVHNTRAVGMCNIKSTGVVERCRFYPMTAATCVFTVRSILVRLAFNSIPLPNDTLRCFAQFHYYFSFHSHCTEIEFKVIVHISSIGGLQVDGSMHQKRCTSGRERKHHH